MTARQQVTKSLQALVDHVDSGAIRDTALPGTSSAEATRLVKNGLSVAAFTCFEHFVRGRIAELLHAIEQCVDLPAFAQLPEALQVAATKGTVEALRFRLGLAGEGMEHADQVALAQVHAASIASTAQQKYSISSLAFGWSRSNISSATLQEFLVACEAGAFFNRIEEILKRMDFDYAAAGLAEGANFKISRLAQWRHAAAHDATQDIDVQLLRTRISTYLALAATFDFLASLAVRILLDSFGSYGKAAPDIDASGIFRLTPSGDVFCLTAPNGATQIYYSFVHCSDQLGATDLPLNGMVVLEDAASRVENWFFF